MNEMKKCTLCPRECKADRTVKKGFCGSSSEIKIARAGLHLWEEPPISGTDPKRGSGTVFFSGCQLKCVFCQNYKISSECFGAEISEARLGDIFLELQDKGAYNINLVSPTPYIPQIIKALEKVRHRLDIPIVMNSGGYERVSTLRQLDGIIDIYLPDLKYKSSELSKKYSAAPDYFEVAMSAIAEMHRQQPQIVITDDIMQNGLIVRHLVLPTCRHDSMELLKALSEALPTGSFKISLMSQYTPFYRASEFKEISRRISTFEYNSVVEYALSLGLDGYMQERSSAKEEYTPDFDLTGV